MLNMTPERWQLVEEIFHAVSEKASEERSRYLREICSGDDGLRGEVESLLAREAAAERVIGFAVSDAASKLPLKGDNYIGSRFGPYQLVRELSQGGMGTVYLAVRSDEHYFQMVAIKLMRSGMNSEEIVSRFRNERQILANLNHPNIAAILDGGSTEHGLPYIVMEFIDGQRITEFSESRELSVRERILLFRSVCLAVHHAHQKLVIHRDIKPSNILVTHAGVPKLLDFGIARLLEPELVLCDLPPTLTTNRMMTPDYASPEQVLGEPLTTGTDVYSLGVVLFELLTGSRPYSTARLSPREVEHLICREAMPKPSELPDLPRDVANELRGDLENIILMAIRKEPSRRYKSAEQLAEDLSRYLQGQPVIAHPDTAVYRARKFFLRHKMIIGAVIALFVALLAGTVTTAWQARRADRERAAAEREAEFLAGMFRAATPDEAAGRTITARELLDRGAQRLDHDLASAPEVRAAMLENIGLAYRSLGIHDKALLFVRRAWELKTRLFGPDSLKSSSTLDSLAELYRDDGHFEAAEPLLRQVLAIREKALGEENELAAASLANLGECLYWEDKNTEAESLLRRATASYRKINSPLLAEADNYLALVLERTGGYSEAIELLREALDIAQRKYAPSAVLYPTTLHNLGSALIDAGDLIESEAITRQAGEIRLKILGRDHPDRLYSLNNLVYILVEEGKANAAEAPLNEAMAIAHQLFGEGHQRVATLYKNQGRFEELKRDYAGADASYRKALDILQRLGKSEGSPAAGIFISLAQLQLDRGDPISAERYGQQALGLYKRIGGDESPLVADSLIEVGLAREFGGDPSAAEPMFRRALDVRRAKFGAESPTAIAAEVRLGEALTAEGKIGAAEPVLRDAVTLAHRSPVPLLPWQSGEAESALAECLTTRGRLQEAERLLRNNLATDPRALWVRVGAERQNKFRQALKVGSPHQANNFESSR